jgi:small-conductance mechanosensitive channel
MMDLSAATSLADPQFLADQIQNRVDLAAGKHIDLASLQLLANTVDDIDIISIIANFIIIIIIILFTRSAVRFVDRMLVNYIPKVVNKVEVKMDETMQLMIRRLVSATIYLMGLMLVILQIPQLHSLATALLAGAGIAGLAIGYASKDSLSNFTSGIFIAIFQPFRVGDFVDFRADYGQVEDLTLRHTIIRTSDNRRIIVPNSIMSTEPIINWSIREPEIIWTVDFDLEKAGDIDRARKIIIDKARSNPMVLKDRPIDVLLISSRYSELTLRLEVTIPGRNMAKVISSEIREAVKKEFEVQGIPPAPTP